MSRKAILQGEIHIRRGDADNLIARSTDETDAILVEGRSSDLRIPKHSLPYLVYLIGILELRIFYECVYRIKKILPGVTGLDLVQTAEKRAWDYDNAIDADVDQIWDACSSRVLWAGSILTAVLVLYSLLLPFLGSPVFGIPPGFIAIITMTGSPFLLTAFPIFYLEYHSVRDEIMARNITEIASTNDYSEVLILVGDNHVPGIKDELESRGWDVESETSNDASRRWMRLITNRF